jgi:uncharacterized membrane protein YkvA (DUF1232 family)
MSTEENFSGDDFWTHLRRFTGKIPFAKDMVAMYLCSQDSKTPMWVKGTIVGALAYFVLPVDAIPDVIVGLGLTDDAGVVGTALTAVASHIKQEHHEQAEEMFS